MLSNNVWSVGKRGARRQKNARKRARSRGRSARLIRRRGRSERISTSVPTPSHPRGNSRIILHLEDPFLLSLLSLFLKDIFNKESRLKTSTYPSLQPKVDNTDPGVLSSQPPPSSLVFFPSSNLPMLCTSPLAPSPFIRSPPPTLLERRKKRKPAAALLRWRNDADRDLKAAFSAEEKPGCLKRARRKTRRSRSFSSSLLLPLRGGIEKRAVRVSMSTRREGMSPREEGRNARS